MNNKITFVPAELGVSRDVFAVQIEHVTDNCIVTIFWRSPANTSESAGTTSYETGGYKRFANGTNLSNNTIISATSDDIEIVFTLLFVPGCFAHFISVYSAVNECGRAGPGSPPVMLDPEVRNRLSNGTSCDADSGSKSNTGK